MSNMLLFIFVSDIYIFLYMSNGGRIYYAKFSMNNMKNKSTLTKLMPKIAVISGTSEYKNHHFYSFEILSPFLPRFYCNKNQQTSCTIPFL